MQAIETHTPALTYKMEPPKGAVSTYDSLYSKSLLEQDSSFQCPLLSLSLHIPGCLPAFKVGSG